MIKGVAAITYLTQKVLINFENWKFKLSGIFILEALISMKFHFGLLNFNKFPFLEILILINFHFLLLKFQWVSIFGNLDLNKFPFLII